MLDLNCFIVLFEIPSFTNAEYLAQIFESNTKTTKTFNETLCRILTFPCNLYIETDITTICYKRR